MDYIGVQVYVASCHSIDLEPFEGRLDGIHVQLPLKRRQSNVIR